MFSAAPVLVIRTTTMKKSNEIIIITCSMINMTTAYVHFQIITPKKIIKGNSVGYKKATGIML